jgi:hypothetical protein
LTCDGKAFLSCGFIAADEVVFGFNQRVKLFAEFGLDFAAERVETDAMAFGRGGFALIRADRKCAIPVEDELAVGS